MSLALPRKWSPCVYLIAAVLLRTSTSKEQTEDDERILVNSALNHLGCNVDVSGNYISEIGVPLKITQTACSLFVEPPGKVVGLVFGNNISIAGQGGYVVGGGKWIKEILFSNSAAWTKQEPTGGSWPTPTTTAEPKVEGSAASHSSEASPCDVGGHSPATHLTDATATSAPPVISATTTFPWWAVGTGIAVAGVGALAGGLAAGLKHDKVLQAPAHNVRGAEHNGNLAKAKESDVRFMSPATPLESTQVAAPKPGGAVGFKGAENAAQPRVLAPPLYLLGLLAVVALCCVLMLAGIICVVYGWRSSKATRSSRVFRSDSQSSRVSEEASEEEEEAEEDEEYAEASLLQTVSEDA